MAILENIMERTIVEAQSGLLLIDLPTGFGKTHSFLQTAKKLLSTGDSDFKVFFVTDLKKNLPYQELLAQLTDAEKQECLLVQSYCDGVIENWDKIEIRETEVRDLAEFKMLDYAIKDYQRSKIDLETQANIDGLNILEALRTRIANGSEKDFRKKLKELYFREGWSSAVKKQNIKKHSWIKTIYPSCDIEKKKVIFMTTKKFFSPFDVFYRQPFFLYTDSLCKDCTVVIDEFDATKRSLLSQIIEDSLKTHLDMVKLFKALKLGLESISFSTEYRRDSQYNLQKIKEGAWLSVDEILRANEDEFKKIFDKYSGMKFFKTEGFNDERIFLFDDGANITVVNDSSKKKLKITYEENRNENQITAVQKIATETLTVDGLLSDIHWCIDKFVRGMYFIAENHQKVKNEISDDHANFYTFEDAVFSVLSVFPVEGDGFTFLCDRVREEKIRQSLIKQEIPRRKGFRFHEVEDSHAHIFESQIHDYCFATTPEDMIAALCLQASVLGLSATARIDTVVGNYDLEYLKSVLRDKYRTIADPEKKALRQEFYVTQEIYPSENISVNVAAIDDFMIAGNLSEENSKSNSSLIDLIFDDEKIGVFIRKCCEILTWILIILAYYYGWVTSISKSHAVISDRLSPL